MPAPELMIQTTYAELLERCSADAFEDDFAENGDFVAKTIKGRRYWYFQSAGEGGRSQKYVGPESPQLLERIGQHRRVRGGEKERRGLISALVRSYGMARPDPQIGKVVAALARAGIFRLRAVLVGTVAYQTYRAMLGTPLPVTMLQTGDVDIAQFANVSAAVDEQTKPVLAILQELDKTFRAVPRSGGARQATSYMSASRVRVDFLTPNQGPETSEAKALRALQTDAEPLRFLDFLIHDPEPAVLLHEAGILVNVPNPIRYAVHKLIVSQRRKIGSAKQDKDIRQAQALLDVLARKRPNDLSQVWREASDRGEGWKRFLAQGLRQIPGHLQQEVREILGDAAATN